MTPVRESLDRFNARLTEVEKERAPCQRAPHSGQLCPADGQDLAS